MSARAPIADVVRHEIRISNSFARLLQTALILMLPLLLVFGSIRLIATDLYLSFEYGRPDFPIDRFGFDTAQRLAYASANLRYVRDGLPIEALAGQNINGAPLYNSRELGHMQDVQGVYQVAGWGWMLALNLFLLVALALGWRKDTRPALAAGLKRGGLLTAGLVAGIGVLVVVAWRMWFTAFHQVFFLPGTWVFNATDTLIRLFPEKFWFDTALMLAGLSLTGGLLVAVIGWRLRRRFQPAPAYIGSMES